MKNYDGFFTKIPVLYEGWAASTIQSIISTPINSNNQSSKINAKIIKLASQSPLIFSEKLMRSSQQL